MSSLIRQSTGKFARKFGQLPSSCSEPQYICLANVQPIPVRTIMRMGMPVQPAALMYMRIAYGTYMYRSYELAYSASPALQEFRIETVMLHTPPQY